MQIKLIFIELLGNIAMTFETTVMLLFVRSILMLMFLHALDTFAIRYTSHACRNH